jgi:hypothetical protein
MRSNGEGSIFPYRNGFAAYVWVDKPDGKRGRKWIYGKTREEVHDKWIKLHGRAKAGPVATKVPTVAEYVSYWLNEVVKPNLAPGSYETYEGLCRRNIVPGVGRKRIDRLQLADVQTWLNDRSSHLSMLRAGKGRSSAGIQAALLRAAGSTRPSGRSRTSSGCSVRSSPRRSRTG